MIPKDGRATLEIRKHAVETVPAVKNIVAENQGHVVLADERLRDQKRLGDALGSGLFAIFDGESPLRAVAQQLAEARQVRRRRNQAELADAALDQRGERIINHRLVIDRLQLFAGHEGQGKQPRTGAAGQDDAFHWCRSVANHRKLKRPS